MQRYARVGGLPCPAEIHKVQDLEYCTSDSRAIAIARRDTPRGLHAHQNPNNDTQIKMKGRMIFVDCSMLTQSQVQQHLLCLSTTRLQPADH